MQYISGRTPPINYGSTNFQASGKSYFGVQKGRGLSGSARHPIKKGRFRRKKNEGLYAQERGISRRNLLDRPEGESFLIADLKQQPDYQKSGHSVDKRKATVRTSYGTFDLKDKNKGPDKADKQKEEERQTILDSSISKKNKKKRRLAESASIFR